MVFQVDGFLAATLLPGMMACQQVQEEIGLLLTRVQRFFD